MSNFEKLLNAVQNDEYIDYYGVDKKRKCVTILLSDYQLDLFDDGKFEIG